MERDNACYSSSTLEMVLEHRFLGELSTELWLRGAMDFEVLRSEVDSHGYDLVIEANGQIRHIQLKALRCGGKRSEVTLSTRLAAKRSGCVVMMVYDPTSLALGPFHWFGGAPGEPVPDLGNRIARHTRRGAGGRQFRPAQRVVRKSAFRKIGTIADLADLLFGPQKLKARSAA
jgi:hypothetical protein